MIFPDGDIGAGLCCLLSARITVAFVEVCETLDLAGETLLSVLLSIWLRVCWAPLTMSCNLHIDRVAVDVEVLTDTGVCERAELTVTAKSDCRVRVISSMET